MRTRKSMAVRSLVLFSLIFTLLFMVCLHERSYAEESKPKEKVGGTGNSSGAGTVTPDLFTGTMSYSIPIEVPEGRKGMSPGLSLDYRSNNGNGWVGVGWELEVGAIERSMKGGVNYSGDDYILRFVGGTMDLVNIGNDEYRAKIEGAFLRVKKYPAGGEGVKDYWEVTDKSGMRYRYGYYIATRQDNPASQPSDPNYKIFKWCLDRVEDANGNYMTFSYSKDQGQIYLDRIDYAGNGSIAPTNYVKFYLEARTDAPDMYSTNFSVKTAKRLKTIEVRANNTPVRAHKIVYDADTNTICPHYSSSTCRSLLYSTQQFGKDATVNSSGDITNEATASKLPKIILEYLQNGNEFLPYTQWGSGHSDGDQLGDFDGDGKTDVVQFSSSSEYAYVWLSNDNEFHPYTQWGSGYSASCTFRLGDFNGDGKTDVIQFSPAGYSYVCISTGSSFLPCVQWGTGHSMSDQLGDFNGDGKTDVIQFSSSSARSCVWLSKPAGNGFLPYTQWGSGHSAGDKLGDFNGDGKTDVVQFSSSSGYAYVWISTGNGFLPYTQWGSGYSASCTFRLGDFNGDGKTDVVQFSPAGYSYVNISTGISFLPSVQWGTGHSMSDQLGDFNGDGKTDVIQFSSSSARSYVWQSTGSGFLPYTQWGSGHSDSDQLGDFNGDGTTDVVQFSSSSTYSYIWLSHGPSDLLMEISNGFGGTTDIAYVPSTQYENTQLPFPVQTVSSVTTNDGRGVVSTMTYTYSGGYYHVGDHDFRGFNHVIVSGPTGSNGEQIITETWYHQWNNTAIISENTTIATLISLASATPGYMKGKPYRTKVKNGQGTVLSETTTAYKDDASIPYFNPALEVNSYIYGSNTVQTKTALTYDAYGNVTKEEQYGDVSITTDDRTIERSYAINETPWIVGLPLQESIYSGLSSSLVSQTTYYYDGVSDCNSPSSNQVPIKGNVTRIVRLLSGGTNPEARMAYDDYGNLKCTRDALGNIATITYDSTYTFPRFATNPLGHVTEMQYYSGASGEKGLYGQVKTVKDPNNMVTTTEYDPFGRKTKVIAADGTWASWAYNNFGNIGTQHIRTDSSAGIWSTTYFDGLGRTYLAKKSGPAGKVIATQTQYNATGTVHRSSLPYFDGTETPRWTRYTYDALGRATEVFNEYDSTSVKACFDGLVTTGIDAEGHKKRQTKDALGRLVKVEEFEGELLNCSANDTLYATTTYEYDVMGNLRFVHDAKGNTTEMRYDSLGRKNHMSDPDMGVWTYTYDANGNLRQQKDAKGKTITFTYDAINRVTLKNYPTGTDVSYTYDESSSTYAMGRLTTMTDASGSTKYFYDKMGRVTTTKKTISGALYTTVAGYEPLSGRLQSINYPGDTTASVWYSYDTAGNLSSVRSGPTGTAPAYVTYTNYTALGQPKNVMNGNGVTTTYTYRDDTDSRLRSIVTATGATGGPRLLDLTYDYWKDGNIKSIVDGVNSARSYSQIIYDGLGRLKEVLNSGPSLIYFYDEIGNILSKEGTGYTQYGLNAGPHAVTQTSDGKTYTYDLNGNMLNDSTRTIAYNYDNMPVSVTVSGVTTTFVYDGSGARVKKITPSGATVYIGKLQECRAGVCSNYIFAGGTRIAQKAGTTIFYYHQDHLGSSRVVTDESGAKQENLYYYPFGATKSDTGAVSMSHKYTSQEYDAETGLYYYNARYYNPVLGRFISADTIVPSPANPQAFNRYSYVLNNPLAYTDPTGHRRIRISHPHLSDRVKDRLKSPVVAIALQSFGPTALLGTYYLTRSEQGRNILAGEIIVGTAVATAYCGGCGTGVSTLIGEISGGYKEYSHDDDILTGVIRGGTKAYITSSLGDGIAESQGIAAEYPSLQITKDFNIAEAGASFVYGKISEIAYNYKMRIYAKAEKYVGRLERRAATEIGELADNLMESRLPKSLNSSINELFSSLMVNDVLAVSSGSINEYENMDSRVQSRSGTPKTAITNGAL